MSVVIGVTFVVLCAFLIILGRAVFARPGGSEAARGVATSATFHLFLATHGGPRAGGGTGPPPPPSPAAVPSAGGCWCGRARRRRPRNGRPSARDWRPEPAPPPAAV
jgi:hypothetical protein